MASIFTRRIVAFIADFFVVSAMMWIVSYLCFFFINPYETYRVYRYFPYVVPILIMVYFIFCEKIKGASVGKALMYLQVRSRNGYEISWIQAIIRNLTKIYWVPIIFDWFIGKVLRRGDRFFNLISKTVVIDELK